MRAINGSRRTAETRTGSAAKESMLQRKGLSTLIQ